MARRDHDTPPGRPRARSFTTALGAVVLLAAGVRLTLVAGTHATFPLTGDAWVIHHEARFVAAGRGLVDPVAWAADATVVPTAAHPPLYLAVLALGQLAGARSVAAQLALNAVLGVATVAAVALTTRRLAGNRAALVAGLIAALHPGLWSWTGHVLPDALAQLLVAAVVLAAYRYLEQRSASRIAVLAALTGLAALTRTDLVLLVPMLIPALLLAHHRAGGGRGQLTRHTLVAGAIIATIGAPWAALNLSRFAEPAPLGTGIGRDVATGTCPETLHGPATGYGFPHCPEVLLAGAERPREPDRDLDESELDRLRGRLALDAMSRERARMPIVALARAGRLLQLWAPLQQLTFDQLGGTRPWWVAGSSFSTFYLVAGLGVAGVAVLARRQLRVWPLAAPLAVAAIAAIATFGGARQRVPAEPSLVILAAVALDAATHRSAPPRAATAGDGPGGGATGEPGQSTGHTAPTSPLDRHGVEDDEDDWVDPRWTKASRIPLARATARDLGAVAIPPAPAHFTGSAHGDEPGPFEARPVAGTDRDRPSRDTEVDQRGSTLPGLLTALAVTAVMTVVGGAGMWVTAQAGAIVSQRPASPPAPDLPPR